jgi:hypothetical protein
VVPPLVSHHKKNGSASRPVAKKDPVEATKADVVISMEREEALAKAHQITEEKGISSPEACVTWEFVARRACHD